MSLLLAVGGGPVAGGPASFVGVTTTLSVTGGTVITPPAPTLPFEFSTGYVNLEPTLDLPRARTGSGPLGPRHRARLARITRGKP